MQVVLPERTKSNETYRAALQKATPCFQKLNSSIIPKSGGVG